MTTHALHRLLAGLLLCAAAGCQTTYEFAPIAVGQADRDDGRAPRLRSDGQYIRAVYADLVGRAPAVYDFVFTGPAGQEVFRLPIDEQRYLQDLFDSISDPAPLRALIAAGLVASEEVQLPDKAAVADPAGFIQEQFGRFLGREAGAYELHAFVSEWQRDPAVGPRTVVRALVGSAEYQSF